MRLGVIVGVVMMLSGCVNTDNIITHNVNEQQLWQDSFKYVIVELDWTQSISYLNPKPCSIDFEELRLIDSLLTGAVELYNIDINTEYEEVRKRHPEAAISKENFFIELSKYVKQVVTYKNPRGEKEVWINCYRGEDVQNDIVDVKDGGNYFFNVKVNLRTKRVYDFSVNGDT